LKFSEEQQQMASKLSNAELLVEAVTSVNRVRRFFRRNKHGHPTGEGLEIVHRTSKFSTPKSKTIFHTMEDGRRLRITVELVPEGKK
jgi:hypothetical protein